MHSVWPRLFLAAVVLILNGSCVFAQNVVKNTIPLPIIVVIDPQTVVSQSKAGQAIRLQHDKYLQGYESEVQAARKSLSEEEAELTRQKSTLPYVDWQIKAKDFDQRLSIFNQKYNKINQAVEKSYISAMNELGKAITQITSDLASDVGANLVLPKQQVILHDPRMDLTKAVIDHMDSKYPSMTFPVPDGPGSEGSIRGPDKTGKK
jgi:outer membrane protein